MTSTSSTAATATPSGSAPASATATSTSAPSGTTPPSQGKPVQPKGSTIGGAYDTVGTPQH